MPLALKYLLMFGSPNDRLKRRVLVEWNSSFGNFGLCKTTAAPRLPTPTRERYECWTKNQFYPESKVIASHRYATFVNGSASEQMHAAYIEAEKFAHDHPDIVRTVY